MTAYFERAFEQIAHVIMISVMLSPVAWFFDQVTGWITENTDYVAIVLTAIALDHIVGTIWHLVKRDFSIKRNLVGLIIKIGLVVVVGILFEGLNHIVAPLAVITNYLQVVMRTTVFLYPAGSALENVSHLTGGKFPPTAWIKRIRLFNENLNPKVFPNETDTDK